VYCLAALPCGRLASGSGDNTIRLWRAAAIAPPPAGQPLPAQPHNAPASACERVLKGHSGTVCALSAMGPGRLVSGSSDRMLSIWLTETGACERVLGGHTGTVWGVACMRREVTPGRRSSGALDALDGEAQGA
jgi:WD40 repeat protein